MDAPAKDSAGSAHLDMLRGVAALVVFFGHLRALMFVDYPDVAHKGFIAAFAYAVAGLGHQAVIVFFVLSGFLVGGSVIGRVRAGRFTFGPYAGARSTRLFSALVPALLLGAALDFVGLHFRGGPGYVSGYAYVVPFDFPRSLSPTVFFGNLAFLQTILVPPLGTNGPLWSLSNEFWYYVAFPCGVVALNRNFRPGLRAICGILAVLVLALIYRSALPLFGVWLLGAAISIVPARQFPKVLVVLAWLALGGALAYCRAAHGTLKSDYALGLVVAFIVYFASSSSQSGPVTRYHKFATFISARSYTLYLCHFPAAVFACAWLLNGTRIQPNLSGILLGLGTFAMIGCYALVVWNLGERHTDHVRKALPGLIARGRRKSGPEG